MGCARCGRNIRQVWTGKVGGGEHSVTEQEVSIRGILKTVTWREVVDMLLGMVSILSFIIGFMFAFWV